MGNYKFFGGILTLAGVELITACSQITLSNQSDLATVLCQTNQSCIANYNEQTWQGEKRREIIKQIAKKYDGGKTLPSILSLQDFSHHQIYVLNAQANWIVFHSTVYRMSKYYDVNSQQETEFHQLLNHAKVDELSNIVRKEFKNTLTNSKFLFSWQYDRNEQAYEKWLNENMPQILEKGGSLIQDKNKALLLEYCNARAYSNNVYHTCITLPANEFLKNQ